MKIVKYSSLEEWLAGRMGRLTGTRLGKVVVKRGTGKKIGFYELVAERMAIPTVIGEDAMERGQMLQGEALDRFEKETGKKVDRTLCLWMRDDNDNIAISPDGSVGKKEAVEVKCLSSARHIEAVVTGKIPDDYWFQVLQYFIVNDGLKKLYVVFYDPRILKKDYYVIEVTRDEVAEEVAEYLEYERATLLEVNDIVAQLTF